MTMYSNSSSSRLTPQDKMSTTQAQRAGQIRTTFARFLLFYTSPALAFFTVRWLVNAVIGIWSWIPMIRSTEPLSNSPSATPYMFGSLCAVGVIMFGLLPEFLALDLIVFPESSDSVFVLFSVLQIHVFMTVMVMKIYTPPVSVFLPAAIITYPITHMFMHHQFLSAGASPAHLGYFMGTSTVFNSSMKLARIKVLSQSEERDSKVGVESSKEKELQQTDGKGSDGLYKRRHGGL